jgi:RNA recognition motif-containing protein
MVSPLIPGKSKDNMRNNIYVKNFPKDFNENDLKKLFEKYGEISSTLISRDENGFSKGFGFVCFTNPINASIAFKEVNTKGMSFPGLPPLYVNFSMKKEERVSGEGYKKTEQFGDGNFMFTAALFESDTDIVISNLILRTLPMTWKRRSEFS